jgi:hypothetical protein
MDTLAIECLRCGTSRIARRNVFRRFDVPECPHCGYLGWAPTVELSDAERDLIRERPLDLRSLRPVA